MKLTSATDTEAAGARSGASATFCRTLGAEIGEKMLFNFNDMVGKL
jgi:hypothetical protein